MPRPCVPNELRLLRTTLRKAALETGYVVYRRAPFHRPYPSRRFRDHRQLVRLDDSRCFIRRSDQFVPRTSDADTLPGFAHLEFVGRDFRYRRRLTGQSEALRDVRGGRNADVGGRKDALHGGTCGERQRRFRIFQIDRLEVIRFVAGLGIRRPVGNPRLDAEPTGAPPSETVQNMKGSQRLIGIRDSQARLAGRGFRLLAAAPSP